MNEDRSNGRHWENFGGQAEQSAFGRRLVLRIRIRDIVRHQGIGLPMINPGTIGSHARHKDVALQLIAAPSGRGLNLIGCRAVLPVVCQVEHRLEAPGG